MRETIYTIPINEAFEAKSGCPLCTLARKLEDDSLDYIMGAAMMEPAVRIETNRRGFCGRHYERMLGMNGRLSLALTLESRIGEIVKVLERNYDLMQAADRSRAAESLFLSAERCFVCNRVAEFEGHYCKNIVYMWKNEGEFRELFSSQPFFCLDHAVDLCRHAAGDLNRKLYSEFARTLTEILLKYLKSVGADVSAFCKSFDYRNASRASSANETLAVERAIEFLSGHRAR